MTSKHISIIIILAVSLLLVSPVCAIATGRSVSNKVEYAPGEVIIKLKAKESAKTLYSQSYSVRSSSENTTLATIKSPDFNP